MSKFFRSGDSSTSSSDNSDDEPEEILSNSLAQLDPPGQNIDRGAGMLHNNVSRGSAIYGRYAAALQSTVRPRNSGLIMSQTRLRSIAPATHPPVKAKIGCFMHSWKRDA